MQYKWFYRGKFMRRKSNAWKKLDNREKEMEVMI